MNRDEAFIALKQYMHCDTNASIESTMWAIRRNLDQLDVMARLLLQGFVLEPDTNHCRISTRLTNQPPLLAYKFVDIYYSEHAMGFIDLDWMIYE